MDIESEFLMLNFLFTRIRWGVFHPCTPRIILRGHSEFWLRSARRVILEPPSQNEILVFLLKFCEIYMSVSELTLVRRSTPPVKGTAVPPFISQGDGQVVLVLRGDQRGGMICDVASF